MTHVSIMWPGESMAPWYTLSVVLASFGLLLADRDGHNLSVLMLSLSLVIAASAPMIYLQQRHATSWIEIGFLCLIALVLLAIFIWEIVLIVDRQHQQQTGNNNNKYRKLQDAGTA